jgi:DNA-binding response OmpR family regulator
MRILVVEDERELSEAIVVLLEQEKYDAVAVFDGLSGEDHAMSGTYDLILLDIMLPGKNGVDVLRSIRKQGLDTPVMFLTAKSGIKDKVRGLDTGADDYLAKPFAAGELMARIRAMTRRKGEYMGDELSVMGTELDKNTHVLTCGNNSIKLAAKEYQILELLMTNSHQIIPKERLIEKIWGFESEAEYNAAEVYISFVRKKLTAIGSTMQIKAVRGVGYSLEEAQ